MREWRNKLFPFVKICTPIGLLLFLSQFLLRKRSCWASRWGTVCNCPRPIVRCRQQSYQEEAGRKLVITWFTRFAWTGQSHHPVTASSHILGQCSGTGEFAIPSYPYNRRKVLAKLNLRLCPGDFEGQSKRNRERDLSVTRMLCTILCGYMRMFWFVLRSGRADLLSPRGKCANNEAEISCT